MGRAWDGYGTVKGRDGELDNSVCPRPFKWPREAKRVRDWYGTGKGWMGKGWASKGQVRGGGKGRIREVKGTSKGAT